MAEQSVSFASLGELVCTETLHVNFRRENNVRLAAGSQHARSSSCTNRQSK